MATGRDAADVAITTSFGSSILTHFSVVTDEVVDEQQTAVEDAGANVPASATTD
jgi:hypothetical protein